ncbi:hypothetical protein [Streptococcus equi]
MANSVYCAALVFRCPRQHKDIYLYVNTPGALYQLV